MPPSTLGPFMSPAASVKDCGLFPMPKEVTWTVRRLALRPPVPPKRIE